MSPTVEVFADISCPFTHLGLAMVADTLAETSPGADIRVRAWPLEWVNGSPLDAAATGEKIEALRAQLGTDRFSGFRTDRWPATTIPALNLAAAAYETDPFTGLRVSLALRSALFEQGEDVSDGQVLSEIAASFDLAPPLVEPSAAVLADYSEGQHRLVSGSPHFWIDGHDYFCPSLDLGHDAAGGLTARLDPDGLLGFVTKVVDPTTGREP
jgi:DSBA-like thioredoxin domain